MIHPALAELAYPIEKLSPLEGNPRSGDVAAVARSYARFGQRKPIVARRRDDGTCEVVAGNHQLAAARELGWSSIAVVFTDDDDLTARAFALADNRTSDLGTYDDELLAAMIGEIAMSPDLLDAASYSLDDLNLMLASAPSSAAPSAPLFTEDEIIDAAAQHFADVGFPFPDVPLYVAMQQLNELAQSESDALINTTAAYHVADPYQPHRLSASVPGKRTILDTFADPEKFRHACHLALESGKLTPSTLRSTLSFTRGAQVAAQFRPGFALHLYRRYAPPGATVLDTSTGYGGRLLAFFASECSSYVGIDPEPRTCAGNRALVNDLCPPSKRVQLIESPAEDVDPALLADSCDFAFTSPPYFAKEGYSTDETQSSVRFPTSDEWRKGFLMPMMALQATALRSSALSLVNIADVTIKSESVPLERWTIEAAQAAGLTHERTERFPLPRVPGRGEAAERFEPVLVFRKP